MDELSRYRLNSMALCHFSKANNEHHSNQKLVWKNAREAIGDAL